MAVIDIGSNSIRLVVFAGAEPLPVPLFNEKAACGLARGIAQTGRLHGPAVPHAMDSLDRFLRLTKLMNVGRLELLATAAVRDAEDGADFVEQVERRFGVSVRVLSGAEEAQLSARGVLWGTPKARGIIGDLGGGSLELVAVHDGLITDHATLPLGPLRLNGQDGSDQKSLRRKIDKELAKLDWLDLDDGARFFAVGGSWRALARLHIAWRDYPLKIIHGYTQPRRKIKNLARLVSRQTNTSVAQMSEISASRREALPVAGLVLSHTINAVRPNRVTFSAYGLREGWLRDQLPEVRELEDPLIAAARARAEHQGRFGARGDSLMAWTDPLFPGESPAQARLRQSICHLVDFAWREHPDYRAETALMGVLHWPHLAADHYERAYIAHALYWRYGGGDTHPAVDAVLSDEDRDRGQLLGLALRLAETLSAGMEEALAAMALRFDAGELQLHLPGDGTVPAGDVVEKRFNQLRKFAEQSQYKLET